MQPLQGKDESEGCYHKVTISPLGKLRNEVVWLVARDRKSNEQFRCKVGFAKITRLQIAKRFEKMNIGDLTDINVNAFDSEGNMFSSLKGYRFHWKISDGNVVQLLKLSQEKVKVGEVRLEVEKKFHSDKIILKSINVGKVYLTAEILESDFAGIKSDQGKLYAVEPFEIYPREPLYILPNNTFTFDLELIPTTYQGGDLQSQPKFVPAGNRKFYSWTVDSNQCGAIKNFGQFFSSNQICTTKISATDTRVDQFNKATNTVNVVRPTAIDISLLEINKNEASKIFYENNVNFLREFEILRRNDFDNSNTWKLVKGRSYLIKNVLMHERHQIRYSLNSIKFAIEYSNLAPYIESLTCIYQNEICLLTTKGTTEDYLTLDSSVQPGSGVDKVYSVRKNVKIFAPLKIEKFGMNVFYLPYLGYNIYDNYYSLNDTSNLIDNLRSQELSLIVTGGTGHYLFNSENTDVIQIRKEILYGKLIGRTRVKVTDSEILTNFDFIEIEVKDVKDIDYLEERQEIQLGSDFYINPIALRSPYESADVSNYQFYQNFAFTNCTNLKMNTTLSLKERSSNNTVLQQIKEDRLYYSKNSNYDSVRSFISSDENKNLFSLFKSTLSKDQLTYLDYINYGICDSRGFKANNEGLIRLSFLSNIQSRRNGGLTKILSTSKAKIFVYSSVSLASPKFDDIFTKELLNKGISDPLKHKNLVVAVGSGVKAKFAGGIMPWTEYTKDYKEEIYLYQPSLNRTSSILEITNNIKISTGPAKEYYLECLTESSEKEIVVIMQNSRTRTLLRPGKSKVHITISCAYPRSLSIFFLGTNLLSLQSHTNMIKDEALNDIFSIPQKEGIEYFEKKNSLELARVYAFDNLKRMFCNITSVQGVWSQKNSLSEKKLFTQLNSEGLKKYISESLKDHKGNVTLPSILHDTKFDSPEYIHSNILFENLVSRFDMYYMLKTGLSHYVTINLIDFPSILPNNMTAYLSDDNIIELMIENGSGDFEISLSDETLAKFEYSLTERKILLSPIKRGILYVYVKDRKISNGFRATATVYISEIKNIQLLGGGLLMVNSTMNLSMKVYDHFDHVFPESQVKKMNLEIGDFKHLSRGLVFSSISESLLMNKFSVRGLISDVYTIYVRDLRSNIVSNNLRIEVFDKLEVFPPKLLMVPGSAYTLSLRGGPVNELHVMKKYEILDNKIASVGDTEPEVKAHLLGSTKLRIVLLLNPNYNKFYMTKDEEQHEEESQKSEKNKLFKYQGTVLAVEEVELRVDFPDSVAIRGALNRKVYTKSTVRLYAALKLGDETFTYGVGPMSFDWELDNTLIAKLRFYKPGKGFKEGECQLSSRDQCNKCNKCLSSSEANLPSPIMSHRNINPLNSLGIFLSTSLQGNVEIKLTVSITYPAPYQWKKPNVFTKIEKFLIQDEIYVDIPEFYENIPNKSSLYLIPIDVDHELHTNKNNNFVKYSVISQHGTESNIKENVISLSDSGRVTSYFQTGMAHVLINQRDKENPAFIPVVVPVFVTDYYSLFAERSYQLIDMEIGQEVTLKILLQHEYGLLFADGKFERFKLRAVESHPRVARAELIDQNSKIRIRANSKGETNVILFHPRTMQILDVFQISVYSSLLLPERINLNIGGKINFLKKDESRKLYLSQDSEWISDDPSTVRIDPVEGVAYGLKEGSTKIHLVSKDRKKIKLSTLINVSRVRKINIDRTKLPQYLTDIKSSEMYKSDYLLPVNFYVDENMTEELSKNSQDDLNLIEQKINFKCISNIPEIFTAKSVSDSQGENNLCEIMIRDIPFDPSQRMPSNLDLIISVESKGETSYDSYTYKSNFKLPFTSSFKIKNKVKEITFNKNNRTQLLYVDNLQDVIVSVEDPSLLTFEVNSEEDEGYVKLYVPYNITQNFNDVKLTLKNRNTGQKEEILLNYYHTEEGQIERVFFGLIRRDTLIDFMTLVILVVTIWILYNYLKGDTERVRKNLIPAKIIF
jgi:hypothetical protein